MEVTWPPQCCVAAFLGHAVAALVGDFDALRRETTRRDLAIALGVTVGPSDPNPWGLPVADDEEKWGVNVEDIEGRLEPVELVLGCGRGFNLEVIGLNTIPFQLFEDAVIGLSGPDVVLGISFDYAELSGVAASLRPDALPGRHVVRLTPLVGDETKEPTIQSASFRFDYGGDIWLFDDSGKMRNSESLVSWPSLIRASRAIDGGLWSVRGAGEKAVSRQSWARVQTVAHFVKGGSETIN